MAAVRTEAQREASRLNGRKSRGPATPEGKLRSRRNGLRDGHFARTALPEDLEAELPAALEIFRAQFRPRDDYERGLVATAALAQVRLQRLQRVELAEDARRVRSALKHWDEAREAEVEALADLLADDPATAVSKLGRTAEGCDYLGDSWQALADRLERSGGLDAGSARRFLALCGLPGPPDPFERPELHALFEQVRLLASPGGPDAGARREAAAAVASAIAAEVGRLVALGDELWERYDRPDRESAPVRAMFDGSADGRRLRRAIAEAERLQRRALAELHRVRAEARPASPAEDRPRRASPAPSPAPPPARSEPEPRPSPRPPAGRPAPRIDLDAELAALGLVDLPVSIVPPPRR
jgi:hypothetical protein